MKIISAIDGIKQVVGHMDKYSNINTWNFYICDITNIPVEASIIVESDIVCLSELAKVLLTSIKRGRIVGAIPRVQDYEQGASYALYLVSKV